MLGWISSEKYTKAEQLCRVVIRTMRKDSTDHLPGEYEYDMSQEVFFHQSASMFYITKVNQIISI